MSAGAERSGGGWELPLSDGWWTRPAADAGARMGLFRIVYALFYLWHISPHDSRVIREFPDHHREELALFHVLPWNMPDWAYVAMDVTLAAALVLLAFGLRTRFMTLVVLGVGLVREVYPTLAAVDEGHVFLVFYIPLFMLLFGHWGTRYSIDGQSTGPATVDIPEWRHVLPARLSLVVLAALFTSSPLFKSFLGGRWLTDPDLVTHLTLSRAVDAAGYGLIANPGAPLLVRFPDLGFAVQLGVLAFEGLFFLVLFGVGFRRFFFALALVFHAASAMFMVVTFTPILIVYGLFVDWERWLGRPMRRWATFGTQAEATEAASRRPTAAFALASAVVVAGGWHVGLRHVFNLWGVINWQTVWFVFGPLGAVLLVRQCRALVRRPGSVGTA